MNKKVSIIIPCYNRATRISSTLRSVIEQSYENWECLVVDDGSTDDTQIIVQQIIDQEPRVKWFTRPDNRLKGANACRNIGIEKCTGDYLIFLDSDDLLQMDCLKNRTTTFNNHPDVDAIVFSTGLMKLNGDIRPFNTPVDKALTSLDYAKSFLSYEIPWQITNPIWDKKVFETYGGFDEELPRFQDVDLHTHLLLHNIQIIRIDVIDFYYRAETDIQKYEDTVFINKAGHAILTYIKKYSVPEASYLLEPQEIKLELQKMFLKTIKKFVYQKDRWNLFQDFISYNKQYQLLTKKQAFYLFLLFQIEKRKLLKVTGLGFYHLEKKIRQTLFQF